MLRWLHGLIGFRPSVLRLLRLLCLLALTATPVQLLARNGLLSGRHCLFLLLLIQARRSNNVRWRPRTVGPIRLRVRPTR